LVFDTFIFASGIINKAHPDMNNPFEVIEARLNNIETLLLDLKHLPKQKGEQPEAVQFLTVHEASVFLNLAVPTIYSMVSRSELPVMKRSKRLYFSKEELTAWIKSGRKKTISESAQEAIDLLQMKRREK
jgi:excisionase family DNA binding protein